MILADVFSGYKNKSKIAAPGHLSKQGGLYRVENFSQLM